MLVRRLLMLRVNLLTIPLLGLEYMSGTGEVILGPVETIPTYEGRR